MKKKLLLLTALLSLTSTAFADESGYVRTGVKTGIKENAWNNTLQGTDDKLTFTEWTVAEGYFKGANWKGFELGYSAKKGFNEDNDHDGFMKTELSPGFGKSTKLGYISGQVTFAEERWGSMVSGSDTIKPKVSAVINVTPKSRIELKALYALTNATPKATENKTSVWGITESSAWENGGTWEETTTNTDDGKSQWAEAEIQYKHELFGGTVGAGVYYGMNKKDAYNTTTTVNSSEFWYNGAAPETGGGFQNIVINDVTTNEVLSPNDNYSQINYLLNYAKYFTPIKVYACVYGEFDNITYKYDTNSYGKKDVQAYQAGLYLSRAFDSGFGVDLEAVRKADLTKTGDDYKAENAISAGVKYSF